MDKLDKPFKVLSLDGGGGKGVYTLGVLREVEKLLGGKLNEHFDLFYGTSTGSIIATALARGSTVDEIVSFYLEKLPFIMKCFFRCSRSAALRTCLEDFFDKDDFKSIKPGLGIVGTNMDDKRAIIFKSLPQQAHGMKSSFEPGFGLTLAEAVEASCSAYPFFSPKRLEPKNTSPVNVVDGGFVANNPALYALLDVTQSLKLDPQNVRFLSIGTGGYPEKYPCYSYIQGLRLLPTLKMMSMQFSSSANAIEKVFQILATGIPNVRVNDTFAEPELATSLFEHRKKVLERLLNKGRDSFGRQESQLQELLK